MRTALQDALCVNLDITSPAGLSMAGALNLLAVPDRKRRIKYEST